MLGNILNMMGVTYDPSRRGVNEIQYEFEDDLKFLESFNGKNVLITGASGDVGSEVWKYLLGYPRIKPGIVTLFTGPNSLLSEAEVYTHDQMKPPPLRSAKINLMPVDMEQPEQIADRTIKAIKGMSGKVDHIFFCHGIVNFMGGLDKD